MPSTTNLFTLTAILTALTTVAAQEENYLRKKGPRKLHRAVNNIEKAEYRQGLEEDVVFWTKMIRNTQEMSYPPNPVPVPVPTPTMPPVIVDPTGPPIATSLTPTVSLTVIDPTDPPASSSTSPPVGIDPTDPPALTSLTPTVSLTVIDPTDPPVAIIDPTDPPVAGPVVDDVPTYPPTGGGSGVGPDTQPPVGGGVDPTDPPVGGGGGFQCPDASFVGCTAVDPADPQDECPTVGEPCPDSTGGEYCCLDACPRNYCTAKQAKMLLNELNLTITLPMDEIP